MCPEVINNVKAFLLGPNYGFAVITVFSSYASVFLKLNPTLPWAQDEGWTGFTIPPNPFLIRLQGDYPG